MPPTVTLNSVTTADADPTNLPHRISDKPTKDTATVNFSVGGFLRAWRLVFDGNRKTGKRLGSLGAVCGIDRCGGPGVMPLAATDLDVVEDATYDETGGPPDGNYPVGIHAAADDGWAA